jgi:hypothetical protein
MSSLRSEARSLTIVRGILAGLTIALCGLPLSAQVTSGTITGRVQDSTGAAIKDASVTVSNPSNGLTRNLTTSDAGEFVAPNLLPGTYNVIVEAPGFPLARSQTRSRLRLTLAKSRFRRTRESAPI